MKNLLKHSWLVIFVCLAITVALVIPVASISIESAPRIYMPKHSDSYKRLIETEEQYGSMISVGVSLETNAETILTPEFVEVIRVITDEIENLEKVESVDSLTNIDFVYSLDGGIASGKLIGDDYTGSAADMKKIKSKIVDWQEMYNRVIIDDNFKAAQIVTTVQSSWLDENGNKVNLRAKDQIAILHKIEAIANNAVEGHDLKARFYGDLVLSDSMTKFMISDLLVLVPLVTLVVLLSLYFSFHTVPGMLLPLISVLMATVWTCGIMSLLNVMFTIIASVIPIALIACGSAYGIHVITHYNAALAKVEGEMTKEKHLEAICEGFKDVWTAVFLAAITTMAGFSSLTTSPMGPLRSFGIFTAVGIVFSLILSITFIPAMLYLTPIKRIGKKVNFGFTAKLREKIQREVERRAKRDQERRGGASSEEASGKTLYNIYHFFTGTKTRLIVFSIALTVFSIWGLSKLVIDTSIVNYFPPSSDFRKDINYVNENFAGTNNVSFIISGQEKGDLTKPEILKAVDNFKIWLEENHKEVGKVVSFTTFIKRMNQVMHVPMLESSGEVEDFSGSDFAEDDWGDSGDDWADDDWAEDDWGESGTSVAEESSDWVDPNIEYAKTLNSKITVQEALQMFADAYTAAGGKNATVEGMTLELEKALNYNGLAYYEIPYDVEKYPATNREGLANLVSQYLLLYSGSLDRFSDDQLAPKSIRMQVQLRSNSTERTNKIIKEAKAYAKKYFPEGYTIEATGNGEMELAMSDMVIESQFRSVGFSIILVFIILSIAFKSPMAGLLGIFPLIFTITLNFMLMGFTGIRLDLVTTLIASVAVGVGIDFTIHFMESYRIFRQRSDVVEEVTLNTFAVSGRGIVTNALAVGLGFAVLMLSKFDVLKYIGFLALTVMFTSSFLAMTIIPGVLNAEDPKFIQAKEEREKNKTESK